MSSFESDNWSTLESTVYIVAFFAAFWNPLITIGLILYYWMWCFVAPDEWT